MHFCRLHHKSGKVVVINNSSRNCFLFFLKETQSSIGLVLKSCDRDPLIEIHANIPAVGIDNWSATFSDGSEHIIPGILNSFKI